MLGDIIVGIALRFTSNGVLTMERLNMATKSANISLARSQGLIDANTAALNRQALAVDRVSSRWRYMRGMVAGGIAVAGAMAIGAGVKDAAQFQMAMQNVAASTPLASRAQLAGMQRLVIRTSGITAQSATTIAQELGAAASAGLGSNPARLMAAFPQIARAADVMWLSPKHINPVQAVTQMSQLSHLFGAYNGPYLAQMVDAATRLMFTQPEALSKMINQGKQYIPAMLGAGIGLPEIFRATMTMGQTGLLSGRGGAGIMRFLQYMMGSAMMTGHLEKRRAAAFRDLFGTEHAGAMFMHGNRFDFEDAIAFLTKRRSQIGTARFMTDVYSGFLAQGGNYLQAVTRAPVQAQAAQNWRSFMAFGPLGQGVEKLWSKYTNTLIFAVWQAMTNLVNVLISIYRTTLPFLTTAFKAIAVVLQNLADFFMKHPKAALATAIASFGLVAVTAAYAAKQLFSLNAGIAMLGDIAAGKNVGGAVAAAKGGRGWLSTLLFGSPFKAMERDAGGRFIAGSGAAARPGLLSPISRAIQGGFDAVMGSSIMLQMRAMLFGTAGRAAERNALGQFTSVGRSAMPGILTPVLRFLGPIAEFIGWLLPRALMRFIPIVGWITLALTAFIGIGNLVNNLPNLSVKIYNWWLRSRYGIGYAFGYALGELERIMLGAIRAFASSLASSAGGIMGDIPLMIFNGPAAMADIQKRFNSAWAHAGASARHGTAGEGFFTGLQAGGAGTRYGGYSVNVQNPTFVFPNGTPMDHAKQFWDMVKQPGSMTGGRGGMPSASKGMGLYPSLLYRR